MRRGWIGVAGAALLGAAGAAGFAGCAKGVQVEPPDGLGGAEAPPVAPIAGRAGGGSGSPGGTGGVSGAPTAGAPAGGGRVPCSQGEVADCTCDATGTEGEQTCVYEAGSPEDGYFGPCGSCAAPPDDEPGPCADGEKNGLESDTDCGGPECDACAAGGNCVVDEDCADAECMGGACLVAASGGSGGMAAGGSGGGGGSGGSAGSGGAGAGGAGGAGGSAGGGGSAPTTPVDDCEGYPEGTLCDRFCLGDRFGVCDANENCDCQDP